jgi:hypothetical protein
MWQKSKKQTSFESSPDSKVKDPIYPQRARQGVSLRLTNLLGEKQEARGHTTSSSTQR